MRLRSNWRFGPLLPAFWLLLLAAACGGDDGTPVRAPGLEPDLLLVATTSLNDSGLLDVLVPLFERRSGVNVKLIAVGSGAALRLAKDGNADALLVHAPDAERALLAAGDVIDRRLVAYNDFLIVGPPADPAALAGLVDAAAALAAIARAQARFLSRGDDSGTHARERALWAAAGIDPGGGWYEESGQGMGATLTIAGQRRAYLLTDRGTFLALGDQLDLVPLVEGDPAFLNLYSVLRINPEKGGIHFNAAALWADFMLSDLVQSTIRDFGRERFGQPLFVPAAGKSEAQVLVEFSGG